MPIYEFHCKTCDKTFDKLCRSRDVNSAPCVDCGAESERQIGTPASPRFNGSGFYETDFKHKK